MLNDLLCFSVIAYLFMVVVLTSLVFGTHSESLIVLCLWCFSLIKFIDKVDEKLDG